MKLSRFFFLFPALFAGCKSKPTITNTHEQDPYLWLEEIEGEKALQFAKTESQKSIERMKKSSRFQGLEKDLRGILLAEDRVPDVYFMNGELYNFWQDKEHTRGLWRKTSLESFRTAQPRWEVVLDLDKLAKDENENWVWGGSSPLPPLYERTLIRLSRGGKDATIVREFDLKTKTFVKDGFSLPESKNSMSWRDKDTVFVGTDFGPGSMTESGYPRIVKLWKRGTPLSEAKLVHEAQPQDMSAYSYTYFQGDKTYLFHMRRIGFYSQELWFENDQGEKIKVPMPEDAELTGVYKDHFLFLLRSDLASYKKGSLVALPKDAVAKSSAQVLSALQAVFTPSEKRFIEWASGTQNALYISMTDDILSKIGKVTYLGPGQWKKEDISLGEAGMTNLISLDWESDQILAFYTDFLTPRSVYFGSGKDPKNQLHLLKKSPERFNAKGMKVERFQARSADGTMIPYFVVGKSSARAAGPQPTLLYGYGGFEATMQPAYNPLVGKAWLESGGIYVLANLRGGGEFGPAWHQSVLKENRYKVYEDFIAIAEDLIVRKITTPQQLGIKGGSNGGLLVGATVMLRPDLFNAVLCQVPLLDMLRYHKLLAGASWTAEYGNPEEPSMREAILKYSPYQRVLKDRKYPEIFFMTSTKDDRVHPGHARKMAAKMKDQGHQILYYENTEGGHSRTANLEQSVLWNSLEFTYLWEKLEVTTRTRP